MRKNLFHCNWGLGFLCYKIFSNHWFEFERIQERAKKKEGPRGGGSFQDPVTQEEEVILEIKMIWFGGGGVQICLE